MNKFILLMFSSLMLVNTIALAHPMYPKHHHEHHNYWKHHHPYYPTSCYPIGKGLYKCDTGYGDYYYKKYSY